ncbi:hypothetical protein Taro_009804, partial [Colocasia esculenta]|nr:hypothetical protein [Colocasia esculenta]
MKTPEVICLCHILVCLDIPAVFLAYWYIAGRFLAFSDIPAIFWLYGTFQSFEDISRELPSSPASSHTQESARHFIEATWVPLHRMGQEARTVRLSLPFSAPRGRICNFSGQQ